MNRHIASLSPALLHHAPPRLLFDVHLIPNCRKRCI
jgi:hypothetical protein